MVLLGMMLLVMMVVAVAVVVVPVTVEEKVRQAGRQERGIKMDWTTNQSGEDEVKKEKKKSEGCSSKSTQADQRRTDTHRQTHRWLTTPPGISHFFSGLPCLPPFFAFFCTVSATRIVRSLPKLRHCCLACCDLCGLRWERSVERQIG